MSLEQELARNTEAMIALTAAITHSFPVVLTSKVSKVKITPAEIEALNEVESPKPSAVTAPEVLTPSEPVVTPVTPDAPAPIEYADVAAAITAVFKVDRVRVVQVLANFGASKGPQLKPEDYAAFLKELQA